MQILQQAGKASIKLPQRFDHAVTGNFRQAYGQVLTDMTEPLIEIDFNAVEYIDSAALGSLLLLRERAEKAARSITLANCKPAVMRVLKVANFHRMFATS